MTALVSPSVRVAPTKRRIEFSSKSRGLLMIQINISRWSNKSEKWKRKDLKLRSQQQPNQTRISKNRFSGMRRWSPMTSSWLLIQGLSMRLKDQSTKMKKKRKNLTQKRSFIKTRIWWVITGNTLWKREEYKKYLRLKGYSKLKKDRIKFIILEELTTSTVW